MNSRLYSKYKLPKNRVRQLYYFAMQYSEWREALDEIPELPGIEADGQPRGSGPGHPTEQLAIRRAELSSKVALIERLAKEAGGSGMYKAVLWGVTRPNVTYNWLRSRCMVYAGAGQYYTARRKFYWLLDKEVP